MRKHCTYGVRFRDSELLAMRFASQRSGVDISAIIRIALNKVGLIPVRPEDKPFVDKVDFHDAVPGMAEYERRDIPQLQEEGFSLLCESKSSK